MKLNFLQRMSDGLTRKNIKKIKRTMELMVQETDWFSKNDQSTMGLDDEDDLPGSQANKEVSLAIALIRLQKDYIQIIRYMFWIIIAIVGIFKFG